jgi:hypothetical protein
VKALVQREDSLIKPRQSQNRISGFSTEAKNSRQINDIRDTGPDTENTDHGPDMDFYGPLVNQSE